MLISFSGSSSSGKSTLLQKCKEQYGEKFHFEEEITRKIKNKGIPINEAGNDLTQLLIINSHLENSLHKNAILDRCMLDGYVYTSYLYNVEKNISKEVYDYTNFMYNFLIPKYDIIFYTEPVNLVDDGIRSINNTFREYTINLFNSIIKSDIKLKDKVITLRGSIEERMSIINKTIVN